MKNNPSFERAVFEGQIKGPEGRVVDEQGNAILPVIDVHILSFTMNGSEVSAVLPKERTHGVHSVSGTYLGLVLDYQG
jgi:hypothetical protein